MPAVTLKQSTTQSSQNCGVLIALRAETFAVVISEPASCVGRVPARGPPVRPRGTRMSSQPTDMNTA